MGDLGGPCWRKATASADAACVEVAQDGDRVLIRDSKRPGSGHLSVAGATWSDFVSAIRAGSLDF